MITSQGSLSQDSFCQLFPPHDRVWSYSYYKDMLGDMLECLDMMTVFPSPSPYGQKTCNYSAIFNNQCYPRQKRKS